MLVFVALLSLSGCGYTTKHLLPENIKSVTVPPIKNGIDLSAEISDKDRFRVYRPGIEVDLTNAIINHFIFDGNLKVVSMDKADAVLEATLVDYRRDPLRYSEGDDIQEYRLSISIDVSLKEKTTGKVIWHDGNLVGDTTFFLSGAHAVSEDEAAAKAVEDLSRRVIEKTIEVW